MAVAGEIQAKCLKMLRSKCRPGVATAELDQAADRFIASQDAVASFKGYRGFPARSAPRPTRWSSTGFRAPTCFAGAT